MDLRIPKTHKEADKFWKINEYVSLLWYGISFPYS